MGSDEFAAFDMALRRSTGEPEMFMIRAARLTWVMEPMAGSDGRVNFWLEVVKRVVLMVCGQLNVVRYSQQLDEHQHWICVHLMG
jgi:hypothetical protein